MLVSIASDDVDEVNRLYHWLVADRDVSRTATVTAREPTDPTTMGGLEVIDVLLTHATAVGSLALAFVAWRQTRPPGQRPTTVTRPDGRTLTIDGSQELTTEIVTRFLADPASDGAGPGDSAA